MCGISGIINLNEPKVEQSILKKMNDAIASRGPDDEGFFNQGHAGLGHRRLSIIDLEGGHQPMSTPDARFHIVFNGEIYNFQELKPNLEKAGIIFQTHSDTEVLLHLYATEGEECLNKLNGMFAFAIWDSEKKELFLARDRMGKKPLYYGIVNGQLLFASELKAILAHPFVKKEVDPIALQHYLTYEYVPSPFSMIKGISKLKQAHCLRVGLDGKIETRRYWNQNFSEKSQLNEKQATKKLVEKLDRAVNYRLISDVPLGVFLSGGVDSSTVVALMARHRKGKDIKTFSINFEEASYDESLYSRTVAKKFGTDHHEKTLTANVMLDILPEVTTYMDEPLADASILPTYLLSHFTRQNVTVALGGDGADELFAGYPTFFANRVANVYNRFPSVFQKATNGLVSLLPISDKNMSLDFKARQFLSGASYPGVLKNQIWLSGINPEQQTRILSLETQNKLSTSDPLELISKEMKHCDSTISGDQILYFYQKFYMCDDILVKVDRASMAHSLEVRAPFLDVNVVEFVNSLPYSYKLKGVTSKFLLKRAFNKSLPAMITQRSKKGFGIPISGWLKNELRPILMKTLSKERLKKDGLFDADFVHQLIGEHQEGKRNNRKQLFSLFMFHQWWDNVISN